MSDFAIQSARNALDIARAGKGRRDGVASERLNTTAFEEPLIATEEQVKAVVEQIDSYLRAARRELQFQVDAKSGHVVVRVRDPATGDIIRQIPGEEALKLARALQENLQEGTPLFLDLSI